MEILKEALALRDYTVGIRRRLHENPELSGVEFNTVKLICDREKAVFRSVELAYSLDRPALVCLLAKGDETRQHEGDEFVPCRTDGDIFSDAVRLYHKPMPEED